MSQRQQQRPHEPIKYGDVFSVEGELTEKPVAPRDAACNDIAAAENALMGQIQRGGAASMMKSAGMRNERAGNFDQRAPLGQSPPSLFQQGGAGITIGEALEATALSCGQRPVEWSDAAAIQAAEVRATGRTTITPGGVAAAAQSAATINICKNDEGRGQDKTIRCSCSECIGK